MAVSCSSAIRENSSRLHRVEILVGIEAVKQDCSLRESFEEFGCHSIFGLPGLENIGRLRVDLGRKTPRAKLHSDHSRRRRNQMKDTSKTTAGKRTVRLVSMTRAAEYLGLSYWTIRGLLNRGEVPYIRSGRRILIDRNDLDGWIEVNKVREEPF